MLDLTVSEELILPVALERAHEVCQRALTELNWSIREQSPTTLVAQEGGIMKWISNPNDLCVFLSSGAEGTRVELKATWEYGKTTGKLLQPVLQGKVNKIRDRISSRSPGSTQPLHLLLGRLRFRPFQPRRNPIHRLR